MSSHSLSISLYSTVCIVDVLYWEGKSFCLLWTWCGLHDYGDCLERYLFREDRYVFARGGRMFSIPFFDIFENCFVKFLQINKFLFNDGSASSQFVAQQLWKSSFVVKQCHLAVKWKQATLLFMFLCIQRAHSLIFSIFNIILMWVYKRYREEPLKFNALWRAVWASRSWQHVRNSIPVDQYITRISSCC